MNLMRAKTKNLNIRISEEEEAAWKRLAIKEGKPLSVLIREQMREFLKSKKQKGAPP